MRRIQNEGFYKKREYLLWEIWINGDGGNTQKIWMMLSQGKEQRINFSTVDQVSKLRREYSYVVFYLEAEKETTAS